MIDNIPAYQANFPAARFRIIRHERRPRELVDEKRRFLAVKRMVDACLAFLIIVVLLSWMLPLLCLLIRMSSRGPAFFVQRRVGFGGRTFFCYKLRTMVLNDEADLLQATADDVRVTTLGRFLRKSNLDELPQFFNILKGDMSLVGPRPHMYADCRRFSSMLPGYKFRNLVKPGLTGLAQVKGFHGPATTYDCIALRYEWDKYYIAHLSPQLDIHIILQTLWQRIVGIFTPAATAVDTTHHEEKVFSS